MPTKVIINLIKMINSLKVFKIFFIIFLVNANSIYAKVVFSSGQYMIDNSLKIIICNQFPASSFSSTDSLDFNGIFKLPNSINHISIGDKFTGTYLETTYTVFFTEFPIIKISTSQSIVKEHDVDCNLSVIHESGNAFIASKIRIRGGFTAVLPKQSYRLTMQKSDWSGNLDTSMFNLRNDKRWLLFAMHNENLKLNNKISHELWMDIHKLYYHDLEPNALSTIRTMYVYIFINDNFNGVYLFAENTDRKQLQLKKIRNDGSARGELYKADDGGASGFEELPYKSSPGSERWGGWEMKYPDYEDFNWDNLYNLSLFIRNSSNSDFINFIGDKIKLDNFSDILIFHNLARAIDNTGKNTIIAKYKENEPYFWTVWDLDGTFGFNWYGGRENTYNDLWGNFLSARIIDKNPRDFKQKTSERWFMLRDGSLNKDSLYNRIDSKYNQLILNHVYITEKLKWPYNYSPSSELSYMKGWINNRLNFLDSYFNSWVSNCDSPTLTLINTKFTNGEKVSLSAEGCGSIVKWYDAPLGGNLLGKGLTFKSESIYAETTYFASCQIGACVSPSRASITVTPNCSDQNLHYNLAPLAGAIYSTAGHITAQIPATQNTTFYSNSSITLNPGFSLSGGTVFEAKIKPCEE